MLQEVTIIPVPQDLQRKLQRKLQKRTDRTKDFLSELNNIEEEYKYSEEEEKDLKELYLKYKGDFSSIMECMMTSTEDDEERFREILEEAIDAEELPMFEAFDEYNYPEDKENEMYNVVRSELDKKTQQRESEFNNMISMMEDKYAQEEDSDAEMI
jgi:hypothetical protein